MKSPWVVITGASRGLGKHLVISFWKSGWSIVLVARKKTNLNNLVSKLEKKPKQSTAIFECDLSDPAQVDKLVIQILSKIPSLKLLINNAAIHGPIGPFVKSDLKIWNKAIQVNFLSPVRLCHGLLGILSQSEHGSIINISGGGATNLRPNFSAYASAKTSLIRFSEIIAEELKYDKIRVNCIAPGPMKTDLLKEVYASKEEFVGNQELRSAKKIFLEDKDSMKKVCKLILFLASEKSKGITGKIISAQWDRWNVWPEYVDQLQSSDAYTLRRITGRERNMDWGDV